MHPPGHGVSVGPCPEPGRLDVCGDEAPVAAVDEVAAEALVHPVREVRAGARPGVWSRREKDGGGGLLLLRSVDDRAGVKSSGESGNTWGC